MRSALRDNLAFLTFDKAVREQQNKADAEIRTTKSTLLSLCTCTDLVIPVNEAQNLK
jgi:hypothetical protein